MAMLFPGRAADVATSMLAEGRQSGCLPRWPYANQQTNVMVGDPAAPMLASTFALGARGFDARQALRAFVPAARTGPATRPTGTTTSARRSRSTCALGYIPHELSVDVIEHLSRGAAPAVARELLFRTPRTEQHSELTPRFHVGDRVRGRNIHPTTHTRMPRYTRGKTGVVERDRGVFPLPDREYVSGEPKPQHVYLIHFTARELWGEEASAHDALYIDMWEDYLEPA